MQILKLAGVQPVDAKMIGADEPEHGSDMDPGAMNKQMDVPGDDAMGSMDMAKMRDVVTAPDEGGMTIVSGTSERSYLAFAGVGLTLIGNYLVLRGSLATKSARI